MYHSVLSFLKFNNRLNLNRHLCCSFHEYIMLADEKATKAVPSDSVNKTETEAAQTSPLAVASPSLHGARTDEPSSSGSDHQPRPLSKSAQKKQARAARLAEVKLERRAREKERKKEKKRLAREAKLANPTGEANESEDVLEPKKKKPRIKKDDPFGARIVIDLGFDELMSDKVCLQVSGSRSGPCVDAIA